MERRLATMHPSTASETGHLRRPRPLTMRASEDHAAPGAVTAL
jgi:hypothetical protein